MPRSEKRRNSPRPQFRLRVTRAAHKPVRSITLDPDHVLLDWNRHNNHRGVSAFVANTAKAPEPAVPVRAPTENWTTYTLADGLLDNKVRTLGMDTEGHLLAGLHLISKKPGTYV